ncbi:hypothetical protein O6H91_04G016700 [Diphasiastrum complanatum]|nr:hypothetical protein O6H91_04G016700 [Diphasiastrum complanatum]
MVASWNRNREGTGVGKGVISIRMMGGGPRTFPGGVTKWQWKRMQEKKQKIREKAWLAREKLIYDRRRRAEMMAATPVLEMPWERHSRAPTVLPVDFDPKIKVMADRFQKDGALDLWTDEDGPEQFSTRKNLPQGPHPLGLGLWRTKPELTNGNVLAKEENSFEIQDKRKSNTSTQTERSKRSASESAKSSIPDRQPIPGRKNIQNINGRRQAGTARKTLQSLPLSEKIRNHRNGISGNSKR